MLVRWIGVVLWVSVWLIACQEGDPCRGRCSGAERCVSGECRLVCPAEQFRCGGACVEPRRDPLHCGGCGVVCAGGQVCEEGQCRLPCAQITPTRCEGACVDPKADARHCGACGSSCRADQRCVNGACACLEGLVACGPACVDLQSTREHCGSCGRVCGAGEVCVSGACFVGDCPAATPTSCFGGCVDLQKNTEHCGSCGRRCPSQQLCEGARCLCPTGQEVCGVDGCVDLRQDQRHCGGCGNACASGQVCAGGTCVASCPAATPTNCFGGCVDLQASALHCGACGQRCAPSLRCKEGKCCAAEQSPCGGVCVDLRSDPSHCGACGNACAGGGVCELGRCCSAGCSYLRIIADASAQRVVVDGKGKVYLAGLFSIPSVKLKDQVELQSNNYRAIFLAAFDEDGQALWAKAFYAEGPNQNTVDALSLSPQGDLYVAGSFTRTLLVEKEKLSAPVARDVFVARFKTTGELVWARSFGGDGEERCAAMVVDATGHATIAGDTLSDKFNGQALTLAGDTDLYVARLSAEGALVWVKSAGGTGADTLADLALDTKGDVYFAGSLGSSTKPISFGFSSLRPKETSAVLGKIDTQGRFVWAKGFEGSGPILGRSVAWHQGTQGVRVYLSGQVAGSAIFDTLRFTAKGGYDGFLLQTDDAGKALWLRTFGGSGPQTDAVQQMQVAQNGEVVVLGVFDSDTLEAEQITLRNLGLFDPYLVRYDATGALISALRFGGSGADYAFGLALSTQGDAHVVGFFASPVFRFLEKPYPKPSGNNAAFLLRVKR